MTTAALVSASVIALAGTGSSPDLPVIRFDTLQLATGIRMHYGEQGNEDGETLIMLHGYSDSWFSFSRVLPLIPENYRILVVDMRGHGESDRPATGYGMRDLASDVIAFMDELQIEHATIVGHSMGSFVAQQVALAAPERVSRLVLVGSATAGRKINAVAELDAAVRSLTDPVSIDFVREFQESTVFQPLPAEFMDRVVAESLKLPAYVWHGLMAGMLETEVGSGLAESSIPTLIVWGEHDAIMSRSEQDALVARIPNAVLKVFPETGHAPHWEQPERFVRELLAGVD